MRAPPCAGATRVSTGERPDDLEFRSPSVSSTLNRQSRSCCFLTGSKSEGLASAWKTNELRIGKSTRFSIQGFISCGGRDVKRKTVAFDGFHRLGACLILLELIN